MTKKKKLMILRRMRELLGRRKGWIQGQYRDHEGGYCLLGAGGEAASEIFGRRVGGTEFAFDLAPNISLTKSAQERGFNSIWSFNDAKKTKKKDVLALLDEKIAELEA